MEEKNYTAIILVIGNEILNGKTQDTNSQFMAEKIHKRGIDVIRCITLPDNLNVLASEILILSKMCDFLFAMGGIGSTPDDVTREAFAEAFGLKLVRNQDAERVMREFLGERANESRLKMADLPEGCRLIPNPYFAAPGFIIENCYVFPGIPELLVAMYDEIKDSLPESDRFIRKLKVNYYEGDFSDLMLDLQNENPDVRVGSYPVFKNSDYKVELTFEGRDKVQVDRVTDEFKRRLGEL
ncbi:competence/damage-inducible protein A [bacterium]|nr:competence/damage-inducible protein A [bacterium]MBU1024552.1 competence/damage-inducible protein A [bacterium]